jgi:hypothetical protein
MPINLFRQQELSVDAEWCGEQNTPLELEAR